MRTKRTGKRRQGRLPGGCILDKPTRNSIWLCGKWINASAIARSQGMFQSHVSMIINGDRDSHLSYFIRIASAIGVTLDELVAGIDERKKMRELRADRAIQSYNTRIAKEKIEDRSGKRGVPRLPGFRLPTD